MAPSLRSSSSSSTSAAATTAAKSSSSSLVVGTSTARTATSTSSRNNGSSRKKQSEITIGSYVKTRQKNFTRYGQVVAAVVNTTTTDNDGRRHHRPSSKNMLWEVSLFPQQVSSIVVQTKDITHVENVDNIPDVFDVPCPGNGTVVDSTTTILSNSDNGRRKNYRRAGVTPAEKNDAKPSSVVGGATDDINDNASDDDQVNHLAKTFVDTYDISSSESIMDTVKAGMRFCYESVQSTLRFPVRSGRGVGSAVAADAAAATTKNPIQATTAVGPEKRKGQETETEAQEWRRSTKMARLIRDTECSLCCEEMMPSANGDSAVDGGGDGSSILATFPCGHALHVRCFMLWHDQHNNNNNNKIKQGKKKHKKRQNTSESVSCPTCLKHYPLGPVDGPFGH